MEEFLENPNEATANKMLEKLDLSSISETQTLEKGCEILRLLFQLNDFNIITKIGVDGVISLLSHKAIQSQILEHLIGVEFPLLNYSGLVSCLFQIFESDDSFNLSKTVLVSKLGGFICQACYVPVFRNILNSQDSVIKVRGLELVIELANNYNFEFFDEAGLIDLGVQMVTENDVLLKMVALDVITKLEGSEKGRKKLLDDEIRKIIKQALEDCSGLENAEIES